MPKSFQQEHVLFHFLVSFLRCQIRALASLGKEQPGSERGQRGLPPPSTSQWWVRKVTHFFLRLELTICRVKLSQQNPSVPLEWWEMESICLKVKIVITCIATNWKNFPDSLKIPPGVMLDFLIILFIYIWAISAHFFSRWKTFAGHSVLLEKKEWPLKFSLLSATTSEHCQSASLSSSFATGGVCHVCGPVRSLSVCVWVQLFFLITSISAAAACLC